MVPRTYQTLLPRTMWKRWNICISPPPKTFGAACILFSGMSVREWVCVCVCFCAPKHCKHHISKTNYSILTTNVFEFKDVLSRFWGQNVKGHSHSRRWPEKSGQYIFVTIWANFTKIRSLTYVFGPGDISIWFWNKKVKGQSHTRRRHHRQWQPVEFHLHRVSKNCANLLLSEHRQMSTNFDNFWRKDSKETKIMQSALISHLT